MNAEPDGALLPARRRLETAVHALVDPQRVPLDHGRHTWLDPLLTQLYDAVAGQSVESKSGGPARIPMWADAFDLALKIDRAVAQWCPEAPQDDVNPRTGPDTRGRLEKLSEAKWRPQDAEKVDSIAARVEEFTVAIQALLLPEPVVYLPKPCPVCNVEWVKRRDSGGDLVNQRTLSIRGDQGARCGSCHTRWVTIGELAILGRMIGHHDVVICD